MANYEIEIKSLIGDKSRADDLIAKMKRADPSFVSMGSHKQLNHYFVGGNLSNLSKNISGYLSENNRQELIKITELAKDFSIRTRQADNKIILVVKASVDDTTSSNGTARMEFESDVNLSL